MVRRVGRLARDGAEPVSCPPGACPAPPRALRGGAASGGAAPGRARGGRRPPRAGSASAGSAAARRRRAAGRPKILGAGADDSASMCRRASTLKTNVPTRSPTTTWLSRSRMNERITRGENWLLASCRLTTVSENTTPAVVIVAPATVLSSHVAALLFMSTVAGMCLSVPMRPSMAAVTSTATRPPTTTSAGSRNRLSRKRYISADSLRPNTSPLRALIPSCSPHRRRRNGLPRARAPSASARPRSFPATRPRARVSRRSAGCARRGGPARSSGPPRRRRPGGRGGRRPRTRRT